MLLVITPFIPLTLRGMVKEVPIYRVFTPRISVVRPFRVVRHEAKASHYISKHQESGGNSIFPGREGTPMYRDSSQWHY